MTSTERKALQPTPNVDWYWRHIQTRTGLATCVGEVLEVDPRIASFVIAPQYDDPVSTRRRNDTADGVEVTPGMPGQAPRYYVAAT